MSRPKGAIIFESLITVPVKKSWVMKAGDKKFVFLALVQPLVYEMAVRKNGDKKLYNNFVRCSRTGLYNTATIYGMEAIDIGLPQSNLVSARLKFVVVENDAEDVATYRAIKKEV